MEKLVLGVFWLLTLLKQPLLPFTFSVRNSDKRISCDEEFSDSEDEGEGGRKNVANFKKAKRVKTEEEKEEEEKKGKIGSPPSCMELCLVCAFLPFYHVFFFSFFLISRGKRRGKSKRGKTRTQRVSPVSLGLAINWLPLYFLVHSPDGLLCNLWGWKGDVAAGMALSWGEVCIGRTAHLIKCCESPQRKGLKNTVYSVHY